MNAMNAMNAMNTMNRKEFLETLFAGTAGVVLGGSLQAGTEREPIRSPTDRMVLGRTGIKVSLIGLGTGMRAWMRQSNHTRMGREAFVSLVRHAYDRGINLFDTADLYGTHSFLRDALKGISREKVVLQTKIWSQPHGLPEQVTDAKQAVERFLLELGTDYIDSVLLHCTTEATWTADLRPMLDYLERAKEKGIARSCGTSCHSLPALLASSASQWVDVQLARINHKGSHMDGKPEEISALLKGMRSAGKGVIGMKIFGEGTFRTPEQREASLRFVLRENCVDAMVIGFEKREEIDETLKQVETILRG